MNYFAHGRDFIADPYFLAGTAVPDWLCVADRQVRARSKFAAQWADDPDPQMASIARGILQHHRDDDWFHGTRAFAELSLQLAILVRDTLPPDDSLRPSFLGHILVELLLDSVLIEENQARLDDYYRAMDLIDPDVVQQAVNRIAPRQTERLGMFIHLFRRERFLWDYGEDGKLLTRLNQVMRRVRLPPLPPEFTGLLPEARRLVADRQQELSTPTAD